jgi:hypothetical protein
MIGKLGNVAGNIPKVYASGYDTGYGIGNTEGKQAEYDAFWDVYQNNGKRTYYHSAFRTGWCDGIYNPKYPIVCNGNNSANTMFSYAAITDTLVPITISGNNATIFYGAGIVTIHSLDMSGYTGTHQDWFTSCTKLANITMVGEIPQSVNFKDCPLTAKSLVSIVEHLSDTASGKTLTVKTSAVNNADWSTTDYESWDALIATKSNWSFSLA